MSGIVVLEDSVEREYVARTYVTKKTNASYHIDFVVIWNVKAHMMVSVASYV